MINIFNNTIKLGIEASVPKCRSASTIKPLPNNILILIQFRNIYRRNWKRYRDVNDHRAMSRLNKSIAYELSQFRNKSWNNMLSTLDKSSSAFWKVSKMLKKKYTNIPTLKHNNVVCYTKLEKAEVLAHTFKMNHDISVNLSDSTTISEVNNVVNQIKYTSPNPQVSYYTSRDKVSVLIKNLKKKKSPGLDGINNKCLKNIPNKGISYLTNIFNACLKLCYFPCSWKISKTIPILKSNKSFESPLSYRASACFLP